MQTCTQCPLIKILSKPHLPDRTSRFCITDVFRTVNTYKNVSQRLVVTFTNYCHTNLYVSSNILPISYNHQTKNYIQILCSCQDIVYKESCLKKVHNFLKIYYHIHFKDPMQEYNSCHYCCQQSHHPCCVYSTITSTKYDVQAHQFISLRSKQLCVQTEYYVLLSAHFTSFDGQHVHILLMGTK